MSSHVTPGANVLNKTPDATVVQDCPSTEVSIMNPDVALKIKMYNRLALLSEV